MLISKCSVSKRFSAFCIDFLVILIVSLMLKLMVCFPIANNAFDYADNQMTLVVEKVNSYTFVYVDDDYNVVVNGDDNESRIKEVYLSNSYKLVNISEYILNNSEVASDEYIFYLEKFYSLIDSNNFIDLKNESGLFIDVNNNVFSEEIDEENRIDFCNKAFKQVDSDIILYKEGIVNSLQAQVYVIDLLINIVPYFLSCLVFLYIIPLINKNRSSLGKMVLHLGVTNKYYIPCNALLMTTRFLSFLLLEMLLSIFLIGIPLIISFLMILLLKNGQCLHDFLSTTLVIDLDSFKPFNNIQEYSDFIKEEREILERSLRKPYEN